MKRSKIAPGTATAERPLRGVLCALLALCVFMSAALAEQFTGNDLFTITYPDGWKRDEVSYTADNTEDSVWLADIYNDEYCGSIFLEIFDGYEGFTLSEADETAYETWLSEQLARLSSYQPEYVGTWRSRQEEIPFAVYTVTEGGITLLEAVTVLDGVNVCIDLYMDDGSPLTEEGTAILRDIVASFTLATQAGDEENPALEGDEKAWPEEDADEAGDEQDALPAGAADEPVKV